MCLKWAPLLCGKPLFFFLMWRWEALLGNGPDYSPQAWLLSVIADWETVWKQWSDKVYPFMGRTVWSGSAITHKLLVANSNPSLPDSCSLPPDPSHSHRNLRPLRLAENVFLMKKKPKWCIVYWLCNKITWWHLQQQEQQQLLLRLLSPSISSCSLRVQPALIKTAHKAPRSSEFNIVSNYALLKMFRSTETMNCTTSWERAELLVHTQDLEVAGSNKIRNTQ